MLPRARSQEKYLNGKNNLKELLVMSFTYSQSTFVVEGLNCVPSLVPLGHCVFLPFLRNKYKRNSKMK